LLGDADIIADITSLHTLRGTPELLPGDHRRIGHVASPWRRTTAIGR